MTVSQKEKIKIKMKKPDRNERSRYRSGLSRRQTGLISRFGRHLSTIHGDTGGLDYMGLGLNERSRGSP